MSESSVPLFRPFPGLRPAPERAREVIAPPYDVVDTEEARAMAGDNPWTFLHISKPEIDFPEGKDPYSDECYAKAAESLRRMEEEGVLVRDSKPCYYAYRITMGDHVQTGLVVGGSVEAYDNNRIRKHEVTRPDKEDDRVRQIDAVDAQTGPALIAHHGIPEVADILKNVTAEPAHYGATLEGVHHEVWVIDNDDAIRAITDAFERQPAVYIADGHHRSAAASRVAAKRRANDPDRRGDELYESFLAVAFPVDEMMILDYNRVVADLNGMDAEAFKAKLGEQFKVEATSGRARPTEAHTFGMYLQGQWYRLTPKEALPPESDPVRRLDVQLLADRVIEPVLGIDDPRRDKRIDFVGGVRGMEELEKRVDSGEMAVAFALYPTQMTELMAVADAEDVMPPKSTWFEPKLADGLVSYPLDQD